MNAALTGGRIKAALTYSGPLSRRVPPGLSRHSVSRSKSLFTDSGGGKGGDIYAQVVPIEVIDHIEQ